MNHAVHGATCIWYVYVYVKYFIEMMTTNQFNLKKWPNKKTGW